MSHWKRTPRMCPECGCEMIFGDLSVSGMRAAVLEWKSRAKYALRERSIFGKKKTVYRPIRHRLMDNSWLSDDQSEEYAWYCPKCGIVDVRFRANHVEIVEGMADNDKTDPE